MPPEILETWRVVFDESTTRVEADIEINFPRDQTDAKFIACALSAEADYLITGDRDLEEARKLVHTTIISVSQFARLIIENWIDRPDHS